MYRRHAAEQRPAHVEGAGVALARGHHGDRFVADVGDDAQLAQHEYAARGLGDVRGGIMQADPRFEPVGGVFGNHFAVHVLVKTINHDAIVARQFADEANGPVADFRNTPAVLQLSGQVENMLVIRQRLRWRGWLRFEQLHEELLIVTV